MVLLSRFELESDDRGDTRNKKGRVKGLQNRIHTKMITFESSRLKNEKKWPRNPLIFGKLLCSRPYFGSALHRKHNTSTLIRRLAKPFQSREAGRIHVIFPLFKKTISILQGSKTREDHVQRQKNLKWPQTKFLQDQVDLSETPPDPGALLRARLSSQPSSFEKCSLASARFRRAQCISTSPGGSTTRA